MAITITLDLPSGLVEHAQYFGQATQRNVNQVLVDTLEMMWPTLDEIPDTSMYPPISSMSDEDVILVADQIMDPVRDQRLTDLQSRRKSLGLTPYERYELSALMQIYRLGLLRKSEGLAEAVHRGLKQPLS